MKNGKKRLYRSKVFWGVLSPALLYVACGLGIFTSVVQLWKAK